MNSLLRLVYSRGSYNVHRCPVLTSSPGTHIPLLCAASPSSVLPPCRLCHPLLHIPNVPTSRCCDSPSGYFLAQSADLHGCARWKHFPSHVKTEISPAQDTPTTLVLPSSGQLPNYKSHEALQLKLPRCACLPAGGVWSSGAHVLGVCEVGG